MDVADVKVSRYQLFSLLKFVLKLMTVNAVQCFCLFSDLEPCLFHHSTIFGSLEGQATLFKLQGTNFSDDLHLSK